MRIKIDPCHPGYRVRIPPELVKELKSEGVKKFGRGRRGGIHAPKAVIVILIREPNQTNKKDIPSIRYHHPGLPATPP
jgi:hypothetical protein